MKVKKSTTTVYRLETKGGRGIYTNCYKHYEKSIAYDVFGTYELDNHPNPYEDVELVKNCGIQFPDTHIKYFRFCFTSKRQLYKWVNQPRWFQDLHKHGVVVAEYKCKSSDVVCGSTQAMFLGAGKHSKKQYNILTYFNLQGE